MITFNSKRIASTLSDASAPQVAANQSVAPVAQAFPDFQSRMRLSGQWLLVSDSLALILSFMTALAGVGLWHLLAQDNEPLGTILSLRQIITFCFLGLSSLLWLDSCGHYRQRLPYWEIVGHIASVACASFVTSGFVEFAARTNGSRLWVGFNWLLFGVFVFAGRHITRKHLEKSGAWRIPAVMIGDGPTADAALRAMTRDSALGFTIIDRVPSSVLADMKKTRAWKQMLLLHDAHYAFLALEGSDLERYQSALKSLPRARVPFSIIPPWLGLPSSTLTPHHFMMQDVMMLHDTNRLKLPLPRLVKRLMDFTLASCALIGLSPIMIAMAIGVRRDGGSALFQQERVGRDGKLFNCYKFRSMRMDAETSLQQYLAENPEATEEWNKYQKLKHDVRVTKIGHFIRRTSLDELPQLLNVIKGDMSLVGPRPCMPGQEKLYADDFSFYESVRPGITGPWQVSGRNQLSFQDRVRLEAWYARNWSVWLDIVIILKTFPTLLKRGGAF